MLFARRWQWECVGYHHQHYQHYHHYQHESLCPPTQTGQICLVPLLFVERMRVRQLTFACFGPNCGLSRNIMNYSDALGGRTSLCTSCLCAVCRLWWRLCRCWWLWCWSNTSPNNSIRQSKRTTGQVQDLLDESSFPPPPPPSSFPNCKHLNSTTFRNLIEKLAPITK